MIIIEGASNGPKTFFLKKQMAQASFEHFFMACVTKTTGQKAGCNKVPSALQLVWSTFREYHAIHVWRPFNRHTLYVWSFQPSFSPCPRIRHVMSSLVWKSLLYVSGFNCFSLVCPIKGPIRSPCPLSWVQDVSAIFACYLHVSSIKSI